MNNYLRHPLHSLVQPIKKIRKSKLWLQILFTLILGIILGYMLGPDVGLVNPETSDLITSWLALPGNLFLQLIKMIIIPLVFSSIIMGIISSNNPEFLKKIGPRLGLYFVFTTTIATAIGFLVAFLIQPGGYIDSSQFNANSADIDAATATTFSLKELPNTVVSILPDNPFQSVVSGDLLGVVIFTIIFGIALLFVQVKYRKSAANVLRGIQDATMKIVGWAMMIAPLAVFGLMARVASQVGLQTFIGLGMYILTVLVGLIVMIIVYMLIIGLVVWKSPFKFLKSIAPVQLLAFSTSSSAAVMPVSMKTAEEKLGIRPAISRFIIPIGATINMDGTALYQVVATVFLSQVFGIELSLFAMLAIVIVTVGASIGAPAAPGIGIVILATILESAGIPGTGIALILGVDRILDMSRTAVNVTGDLTAATFFDKFYGKKLDKK